MNKRIYWIDWLKVFTMILVVYAHACSNMVVTMIYSFHMPLFFLISGFLHKPRAFKVHIVMQIRANAFLHQADVVRFFSCDNENCCKPIKNIK